MVKDEQRSQRIVLKVLFNSERTRRCSKRLCARFATTVSTKPAHFLFKMLIF
ncbi:unnamed protein product [Musa acuminata subsp. malaccensis]|uniref:(wild Malaysian banana) hypothetical protein n=1 Tax=Musa acuminata subsp. malaccensis TaxID=214687 RepID=A0A804HQ22_MUSAM|nr:unnamed protein product [Musa acuminata subsp. malaccensis]